MLHCDCNNQGTMQVKKAGEHQLFCATRTHAHLLICIAKQAMPTYAYHPGKLMGSFSCAGGFSPRS